MVSPAVPEITEGDLGEALDARTEALSSLRELGPPDLVHLLKQNVRNPGKKVGIYHHVTGTDGSSSASLAAYLNTLTHQEQGPNSTTRVVEGVYCCYNAFSRLDMRIHVTIPGTTESYCVDERGEKRETSDELWLETHLCSVLRAYSYADDGSGETIRKIIGVRRFNPVTNTEAEHRFLNAAEKLFFSGFKLGSESTVQVPTHVNNHLTEGLLRYIKTTGRYASGINLFEKLRTQSVEVSSLLAKVQFMANEEVAGIRTLYQSLSETPMDYMMLDIQAEYLIDKAEKVETPEQRQATLQMALGCADRSTIAAPSEFGTWARLAQVYVAMEDWENALTTLNSCPMFTYQDRDMPIMPEPRDLFMPIMNETRLDELDSEVEGRYSEQVDANLLGLRAATYKGTFREAYNILAKMTAQIGWDQLLKIRSHVFVMEDEYRTEKQDSAMTASSKRTTSIEGLRGTPDLATNGDDNSTSGETAEEESAAKSDEAGSASANGADNAVEKPPHTIDPHEVKTDTDNSTQNDETLSKLNTKRLCERWLDGLFMVLYEDLRVYTIWRTQMAQHRAQQVQYRRSAEEWEILGALSERLQHYDEGAEAYRACLSLRFSPKALAGVLNAYRKMNLTQETVSAVIRLVTWQFRWYSQFSPELLQTVRCLIEDQGAVKTRSIIQATNLPQAVLDLTHSYAQLCAEFRSNGSDG